MTGAHRPVPDPADRPRGNAPGHAGEVLRHVSAPLQNLPLPRGDSADRGPAAGTARRPWAARSDLRPRGRALLGIRNALTLLVRRFTVRGGASFLMHAVPVPDWTHDIIVDDVVGPILGNGEVGGSAK